MDGTCRLCLAVAELRRSHIIPNALFKRIKQRDAGKAVRFDDATDSVVEHTSESWWEYLLCEACEAQLGRLDKYGVEALERARKAAKRRSDGVVLKPLEYALLKGFFTALVWRAAIATIDEFHQVQLAAKAAEVLRNSLLEGQALSPRRLACRLAILFDPTPVARGGLDADNFGQLICSPRLREISRRASFLFLLDGFLIEVFASDPPSNAWRGLGILKDVQQVYIPPRNIFDVPELKDLLVVGFGKDAAGKVSPSIKMRR
jgi:hypothetical protein